MIYRVPAEWIERRRRMARFAPVLICVLGAGILAATLGRRVHWSNPQDRFAAILVMLVVATGLLLGWIAGRYSFRTTMRRWEGFSIQLTPNALIRQMDGQETRITRASVTSVREIRGRGFVVTDNLGWRIFVPKMVANYDDFREQILTWCENKRALSAAAPTAEGKQ